MDLVSLQHADEPRCRASCHHLRCEEVVQHVPKLNGQCRGQLAATSKEPRRCQAAPVSKALHAQVPHCPQTEEVSGI